jgi:hypothetical protein
VPLERIDGLISFSDHFEVDREALQDVGAFDPLLDVDLPYAIDPKLLQESSVPEMQGAHSTLLARYRDIYVLLQASKSGGDRPWREALKLVNFPEFKGPCLGFAAGTAAGRGWGPTLREKVLRSAKEVISLGITDPRFFELVGVFEEGIGPDLISDMIGTILVSPLASYTKRVCDALGLPTQQFQIGHVRCELPGYFPEHGDRARYIILVPEDILTEMPVALDRSDVPVVAEHSDAARRYLNETFGADWRELSARRKEVARAALLSDASVLNEFLSKYEDKDAAAYNFDEDPRNLRLWYDLARRFLESGTLPQLRLSADATAKEVAGVVRTIVTEFKRNVEHNGLWQLFYNDNDTPRREAIIQRTFQAVAQAHCAANNLDLAVEVNAGRGPVDFKVTRGSRARVLVEFKRSMNSKLLQGYRAQVATYAAAEAATDSFYVVIDFGENDHAMTRLYDEHAHYCEQNKRQPHLIVIEAWHHASASRA